MLSASVKVRGYVHNEFVYERGHIHSGEFFLLTQGEVEKRIDGQRLQRLRAGDFFGIEHFLL
jgi:uncharacterized cupin superfamily protein